MNIIDRSRSNQDRSMFNLLQFVQTQYHAAPRQTQNMARQFYRAMDRDGSGSVDYSEFKSFLVSEGLEYYSGRNLFMMLDTDRNRGLDFWEVMTLYYIIKSGRPFCLRCDKFLSGIYSICNMCRGGPSYTCNNCYHSHMAEHLQPQIRPSMNRSQTSNNAMGMYLSRSSSSYSMVPRTRSASSSSSQFMVPNQRTRSTRGRGENSRLSSAFDALETAMDVADIAANIAACSIM